MDESMHYNEIIKHNEVNFRLSQEILWPRFDGNESGQLTETLKKEHFIFLSLTSHRVMGSARHRLAKGSFKKQKSL